MTGKSKRDAALKRAFGWCEKAGARGEVHPASFSGFARYCGGRLLPPNKSAAARPRQNQGGTAHMRPRGLLGAFLLRRIRSAREKEESRAACTAFRFRRMQT